MKWSDTWFKMCDSFNEWKGRLVSEKGLETSHGKKTLLAGCCVVAVLGAGLYKGYDLYLERDYALRAENAMRGGFYKEAFKNYQALAERGDLAAIRQVAEMYFEGQGTPKNPEKAIKLLREAADRGDSDAMTRLGMLYFSSSYQGRTCLGHDYRQAMDWFLKAGRNPDALEAIGTMYSRGLGVQANERLAQNYFDKWINTYLEKARGGDAKAQYFMGVYLIDGLRHEINEQEAISWFEKSASQGYVKALESLGFLYRIGGETIEPNNEKAMEYFSKLKNIYEERASKGDASAMIYLAEMYQKGEGVPHDNAQSLKYYLDASEAGSIAAKENLADLAENDIFTLPGGFTPERLRREARDLREELALGGDITLMKELGFGALGTIASRENEQQRLRDEADNVEGIKATRAQSMQVATAKSEKKLEESSSQAVALTTNSESKRDTSKDTSKEINSEDFAELNSQNQVASSTYIDTDSKVDSSDNMGDTGENVLAVSSGNEEASSSNEEGIVVARSVESDDSDNLDSTKNEAATKAEGTVTANSSNDLLEEDYKVDEATNARELYALYDEAIKWFTMAAEAGDAPAMLELGRIYRDAQDSSVRNDNLAVNWFLKSAQQCYEPAYLELGAVYEQPNTPLENAREAIHWFELAAMQGSTEAQMQLARLFARGGRGVQPDYISALKWLLVVKKGAELTGETGEEGVYSEVLELEQKYAHYLTEDEVKKVHQEVERMVEKYGTNW